MHVKKQKPNLLALGCSHASTLVDAESWPDYVANAIDYNLIRASSCGAGTSFYIEKLNNILQNNIIDLIVIQLTEPSRVVLGLTSKENEGNTSDLNQSLSFNDLACYTWNSEKNENNIKTLTGHEVKIDNFFIREVILSKWVDYKIMQDVSTMQYMCNSFKVPCIFWSWFVPMEQLFIPKYEWLKNKINYVDGCARQYIKNNNIKSIPYDSHYNASAHSMLCNGWLMPEITKKFSHLYAGDK